MTDRRDPDVNGRVGEHHPRAALYPDALVTEVRNMREWKHMRYQAIIDAFAERDPPVKLSYRTVRKWCLYERRANP